MLPRLAWSLRWTAPAFFDFSGASVGADIGVKAGSVAMLLMSKAVAPMRTALR